MNYEQAKKHVTKTEITDLARELEQVHSDVLNCMGPSFSGFKHGDLIDTVMPNKVAVKASDASEALAGMARLF